VGSRISESLMKGMGNYYIEGTSKSPQIDFNPLAGELILTGRSIPENAAKVYEPLLSMITDYVRSPRQVTNFRLNLEYFNSASLLWFAKIIRTLGSIKQENSLLLIHIYFDIEDFESMDTEEIKDIVSSLVDNIGNTRVSTGIKIYGTDSNHLVVKETTILT
jgi:SiaC family regulatory phosphoprotein